ncbi:DJ-1/PfpI family protein [Nostoc sp. FACHB-973]|nr:DJ-1/PfpI family protein [Nostoc sp. FACHB-973]
MKKVLFPLIGALLMATPAIANNLIQRSENIPHAPRLSTEQLISAGAPENEALKKMMNEPPQDTNELKGKSFAILATDGVEEIELTLPYQYLKARGARVELISPAYAPYPDKFGVQYPDIRKTHIKTVYFIETAGWFKIDRFLDQAKPTDYDAVIVPGGAWNPDILRNTPEAVKFIQEAAAAGKVVGAICHGPQVLINAGLLKGKKATAYWNVHADLANAGATVIDEPVIVDGKVITSRGPLDLPQFVGAVTSAVKASK